MEDWINYEINGYPNHAIVPEYRIFTLNFKGDFVGFAGSTLQNTAIPPDLLKKIKKNDKFDQFYARQAVTTIDASDEVKKNGIMRLNYPDL